MPSFRARSLAALSLAAVLAATPARAQMGPPGPPTIGVVAAQKRAVTESSEFTGRVGADLACGVLDALEGLRQGRICLGRPLAKIRRILEAAGR